MSITRDDLRQATAQCLVTAGSSYTKDRLDAYARAIERETIPNAKWFLEILRENAVIAEREKLPLCDDTGIPHVILRIGDDRRLELAQIVPAMLLTRALHRGANPGNKECGKNADDGDDNQQFNPNRQYAFLRKKDNELIIVIANFDENGSDCSVKIPAHAFECLKIKSRCKKFKATDLLTGETENIVLEPDGLVKTNLPALCGKVLKISLK